MLGVLLTGMGRDGAEAMAALREHGGRTIEELAARRSATANAVYKLLHRLRQSLHDCVTSKLRELNLGEVTPAEGRLAEGAGG